MCLLLSFIECSLLISVFLIPDGTIIYITESNRTSMAKGEFRHKKEAKKPKKDKIVK